MFDIGPMEVVGLLACAGLVVIVAALAVSLFRAAKRSGHQIGNEDSTRKEKP